jgi:glycerol-3-phosphate dehydrogenase
VTTPTPASTDTSTDRIYDLVVIGGGITGAGIARDAALRGMKVAVFEKGDWGSGTSSKSSKMIHGGLRYLEHGELGLVFESVSERKVQSRVAPHLVRPMPFLVPIFKDSKPGLELMNIGLWIYDSLALFRSPRLHKTFRGAKAAELEPHLASSGLRGVIEYYDCVTDDARLVLENVLDARNHGADCRSYTEVTRIERDADRKVRGVVVRDLLTGAEEAVATRALVMAAGAWTDEMTGRLEIDVGRKLLRRTKGVHVVFPREKLPLSRAITLISPLDGRVMFAIPWNGRTVIGTTDTDFEGTADDVHADAADAKYLCDSANQYFPRAQFKPDEIIATWAGLRPLIADEHAKDESAVSREHEIFVREDGIVIIAGGKLTTYRLMAKEAVKKAIGWLERNRPEVELGKLARPGTKRLPLPGAVGMESPSPKAVARLAQNLSDKHQIALPTCEHLARVYGVRASIMTEQIEQDERAGALLQPDLPYLWAEIDFAVTHDLARTVDDVLIRRVPLLLVGRDQGLDVCERVAVRMQEHLLWTDAERDEQIARYKRSVADSRRFRSA